MDIERIQAAMQNGGSVIEERTPPRVPRGAYEHWVRSYAWDMATAYFALSWGLTFLGVGVWAYFFGDFAYWRSEVGIISAVAFFASMAVGGLVGRFTLHWRGRELVKWVEDLHDRPSRIHMSVNAPAAPRIDVPDITIQNTRGTAIIKQPEPGAFIAWLNDVLSDANKIEFSRREQERRGWDDDEYNSLIGGLRNIGWLRRGTDKRGVYTMTAFGREAAREWLRGE